MDYKEYAKNQIGKKGILETKEGLWRFSTITSSPNVTLTEVEDDFAVFSDGLKIKQTIPLDRLNIRAKGEKINPGKT